MSFTSTPVAGGTTGTLADAAPAIDRISSVDYQRVKQANPNVDQTGAYGIDSDPVRVRPRRRGTSDYDSGNVAVAASAPAVVTAATIFPEGGHVVNTTNGNVEVTLTNTAGDEFFHAVVPAKSTVPLPLAPGGSLVGVKAGADVAGARFAIWGGQ